MKDCSRLQSFTARRDCQRRAVASPLDDENIRRNTGFIEVKRGSHETSTTASNSTTLLLVAVCISGQMRSFQERLVYRNIFWTMVAPIRQHANVFMALDAWSKDAYFTTTQKRTGKSNGNVGESNLNLEHELPSELMELFQPVALVWGHASSSKVCDGAATSSGCAYNFSRTLMTSAFHHWTIGTGCDSIDPLSVRHNQSGCDSKSTARTASV